MKRRRFGENAKRKDRLALKMDLKLFFGRLIVRP
jgi:hypothetical protein